MADRLTPKRWCNMAIKLLRKNTGISQFDPSQSLGDQMDGLVKVQIDTEKNPDLIKSFLASLEEISKIKIPEPFEIEVLKTNTIFWGQVAKKAKKIEKDLRLSWITKQIVLQHIELENKLEDIKESFKQAIK
jgi:hypothetical protein